MKNRYFCACALFALALPFSTGAQQAAPTSSAKVESTAPKNPNGTFMAPSEIVATAPASDWVAIAPSDLLVMELAEDAKGKLRHVVIQLVPKPLFASYHVNNIRKLATAKFWDGTSVNRVQDNYVTQWGDATEKKALPNDLETVSEDSYLTNERGIREPRADLEKYRPLARHFRNDAYASYLDFEDGWPFASNLDGKMWPVHCYGMVGVGRNLSPDTGTGAELYTVIGHAPRHLDRNIALVGRVISGMEHLSSLPRGTGPLGFYETPEERTTIISVAIMDQIDTDKPFPIYEYLSTESASFAAYADARANRRDPFFNLPAGGADICNIPVPIRTRPAGK